MAISNSIGVPKNEINALLPTVNNRPTVSGTITLDFNAYSMFVLTLTGDTTINFTNVTSGTTKKIIIKQDNTGGRVVTWDPVVKFTGGNVIPVEPTASKATLVSLLVENSSSIYVETFNYNY